MHDPRGMMTNRGPVFRRINAHNLSVRVTDKSDQTVLGTLSGRTETDISKKASVAP